MQTVIDVSNDPEVGHKPSSKAYSSSSYGEPEYKLELELTEASGAFLAWSILVIVEGVIRTVRNANPEGGLTPAEGFPPLALLVAGLAEVTFGGVGILLAVSILMFKMRDSRLNGAFLIFQSVLGWFVFITYVLAVPLYELSNLEAGRFGLSRGVDRFLIGMGMVTSISWCAALQSGQFVLAARVRSMIKGKADTLKMHRVRAIVWICLAMVAGVAILLTGAVFAANAEGSSPHIPPGEYPPSVTVYPEMLAATGAVVIGWTVVGLVGAVAQNVWALTVFNKTWFVVFFANVISFALAFGRLGPGPAFAAAQHTVLALAYTLLPVVFTRKMVEWKTE